MVDGAGHVSSPLSRDSSLPHQDEETYEEIQWGWANTANDWWFSTPDEGRGSGPSQKLNKLLTRALAVRPPCFNELASLLSHSAGVKIQSTLILVEIEIGISNGILWWKKIENGGDLWLGGVGVGWVLYFEYYNSWR